MMIKFTRRDMWREIEVTRMFARMSLATFGSLPNYSASLPTGTRVGKRWRCAVARVDVQPGESMFVPGL